MHWERKSVILLRLLCLKLSPCCAAADAACRNLCSKKHDEEDEEIDTHQSKLEVHFFSFTTFYYLVSCLPS